MGTPNSCHGVRARPKGILYRNNMPLEVTVGLIAGEMRSRAERSLRHLLRQTAIERMEIVVVDMTPAAGPIEGADDPRVRYVPRSGYSYYCEAQAEIMRQAKAPIVAYIEDHCFATPEWAASVLDTFSDPKVAVVNYTFTNANPDTYLSRSILVAEYGRWMAPHPGGPVAHSSSTNVAYRTDLLRAAAGKEGDTFEAEFLIHRHIRERGGLMCVSPRATVAHESWLEISRACVANGSNTRVLGARRAELGRWGLPRRLAMASAMTIMPALGLARLAWSMRNRPALWSAYVAALPVVSLIYAYCAWSEALGYVVGEGGSREEFRRNELGVKRDG